MNSFKKLLLLNKKDKQLFFEALIILFWVKLVVILFPLRWYSKILGTEHKISNDESTTYLDDIAFKISQAIARGRRVFPWKPRCLCEAVSAKIMLNRRNVKSTLYLGVAKDKGSLIAHAWLICGTKFVTGRAGAEKFTVVSTFA
jgi:hypothetical protein